MILQNDFCLTCEDGYGGLAGGLVEEILGGKGGAGFGGRCDVELVLFKVDDAANNVDVLEAVLTWKGLIEDWALGLD